MNNLLTKLENYLRFNFIVITTIAYVLGICLFDNKSFFLIASFSLFFLLIISLATRKFFINLFIFYMLLFLQIGFINANFHWFNLAYFPLKNKTTLDLKITSNKKEANNKKSFFAKTANHDPILIVFKKTSINLPKYADKIKASGKFYYPDINKKQFQQYLFVNNIKGIFYVNTYEPIQSEIGNPLKATAYFLKDKISLNNLKSLPQPYSTLLTSLVFGKTDVELPQELEDSFQKAGLIHILVVSGAQVALLTGILIAGFKALSFTNLQIFFPITLINIIFYFLTGGGASIFRAVLMVEIILAIKLFKKNADIFHIFCLTGLIMLLINPSSLFNLSFQFSFLATFSLLYGVPKINQLWPEKLHPYLKNSLSVTLAPFIFTTPIIWFYFQKVSLISLLSNLIIINLVEAVVPLGFFASLIGLIFFPLQIVINNFNLILVIIIAKLTTFFAHLPFALIYIAKPSAIIIIFIYFLILVSLNYLLPKKNPKIKILITLLWFILFCYLVIIPLFVPKNLEVTYFSVGEADAALIQTPQRKNILIDLGSVKKPAFQPGLTENLIKKGINKIDLIILSHFHLDHIGELEKILTTFQCKYILDNGNANKLLEDEFTKNFAAVYFNNINEQKLIHLATFSRQSILIEPNLKLQIIFAPQKNELSENENNNSLVLKLSYFKIDFLFMGDLEKEQEEIVLNQNNNLDAEVIKIAHHGSSSSTSESLLQKVNPELAIISVGKNKFKHPAKSTLTLLNNFKIKTMRTDCDGNITLLTDGKKLFYKTDIL
jgi:competence protein ComEC